MCDAENIIMKIQIRIRRLEQFASNVQTWMKAETENSRALSERVGRLSSRMEGAELRLHALDHMERGTMRRAGDSHDSSADLALEPPTLRSRSAVALRATNRGLW